VSAAAVAGFIFLLGSTHPVGAKNCFGYSVILSMTGQSY